MDDFLLIDFKLERKLDEWVQTTLTNFQINDGTFAMSGLEVIDPKAQLEYINGLTEEERPDLGLVDDGKIQYRVFFVDSEEGERSMNDLLLFFRANLPDFEYEFEYIDNSNWEDEWKKSFTSFPIGKRVWIKPSWEEDKSEGRIMIVIEPKMAFGTGTHETTALCMEYIEDEDLDGLEVLDIGCGSGILSILASKLRANSIDACDIDSLAVENAMANAKANGVSNINVFKSDLLSQVEGQYDLIFANILANIILLLLEDVDKYMRPGARLVLSGILDVSEEKVLAKLEEKDYRVIDRRLKGEWVLLVADRKDV